MASAVIALVENTRVVTEAAGRYHEPVAAALYEYFNCLLMQTFFLTYDLYLLYKVSIHKVIDYWEYQLRAICKDFM
jgi:hypothetical protein